MFVIIEYANKLCADHNKVNSSFITKENHEEAFSLMTLLSIPRWPTLLQTVSADSQQLNATRKKASFRQSSSIIRCCPSNVRVSKQQKRVAGLTPSAFLTTKHETEDVYIISKSYVHIYLYFMRLRIDRRSMAWENLFIQVFPSPCSLGQYVGSKNMDRYWLGLEELNKYSIRNLYSAHVWNLSINLSRFKGHCVCVFFVVVVTQSFSARPIFRQIHKKRRTTLDKLRWKWALLAGTRECAISWATWGKVK